jgi:hypothetical protein
MMAQRERSGGGYKKYTCEKIDGARMTPEQHLQALIAAWMLPAVKARDDETFQRKERATLAAIGILLWRSVPKEKRARRRHDGPASKSMQADMQWLRDEATPQEWREVAEMLETGCGAPNKLHLAALQSCLAARKEKGKDMKFNDVLEKYAEVREQIGPDDLPVITKLNSWRLRRPLKDMRLLEKESRPARRTAS